MAKPQSITAADVARYRQNYIVEMDGIALYRVMAAGIRTPRDEAENSMTASIDILLVADAARDAALVLRALAEQVPGAALEHAQTKDEYLDRLKSKTFDIVVSDGSVAECEGLRAFYLVRERYPCVRFIHLSGLDPKDGDAHGLEAIGVDGFVSKGNLQELGSAVAAALREAGPSSSNDAKALAGYERLVSVIKELSLTRDLAAIMAIVRRAARALSGADGATFVLRDGDCCYYADEEAIGPLWKGQRFPLQSCISGWAMIHQQPAVVEDIYSDARIPIDAYEPTFVRSVVMVPIRAMEPIGAIGAY